MKIQNHCALSQLEYGIRSHDEEKFKEHLQILTDMHGLQQAVLVQVPGMDWTDWWDLGAAHLQGTARVKEALESWAWLSRASQLRAITSTLIDAFSPWLSWPSPCLPGLLASATVFLFSFPA